MSTTSAPTLSSDTLDRVSRRLETCFDVDPDVMTARLSVDLPALPQGTRRPSNQVCLSPVSTYIQGSKGGTFGYVVSSIASHWGIVVDHHDARRSLLYHLVFEDPNDAVTDSNPSAAAAATATAQPARAVKFAFSDWDKSRASPDQLKLVGETQYGVVELLQIGKACPYIPQVVAMN